MCEPNICKGLCHKNLIVRTSDSLISHGDNLSFASYVSYSSNNILKSILEKYNFLWDV